MKIYSQKCVHSKLFQQSICMSYGYTIVWQSPLHNTAHWEKLISSQNRTAITKVQTPKLLTYNTLLLFYFYSFITKKRGFTRNSVLRPFVILRTLHVFFVFKHPKVLTKGGTLMFTLEYWEISIPGTAITAMAPKSSIKSWNSTHRKLYSLDLNALDSKLAISLECFKILSWNCNTR